MKIRKINDTPLSRSKRILIDVLCFLSRTTLEFAGSTLAFAVIYFTLYFARAADFVHDYRLVIWGWLLLTWFCAAFGACISAATELSEAVGHFIQLLQFLSVPLSPTFYMVSCLPLTAQDILNWDPLTYLNEMIRAGFFGRSVNAMHDATVTFLAGLVLFALGIPAIMSVRERLHDA